MTETSTLTTNVIRDEEAARAAVFGRATAILAVIGIAVGVLRQATWQGRLLVEAPLAVLGLVGSLVWWRSRDARTYSRAIFRVFGVSATAAALVLIYSLGVFTPVPIIMVAGLAFFLNSADRTFATMGGAIAIVAFVAMAVLTSLGILPDAGLWRVAGRAHQAAMTLIVTAVLVMQLLVSLSNRRALQDALLRAQDAMRVVRTREAQLDEARENLDVAMKAGKQGRLTGMTLGGWRLRDVIGRGAMGEVYASERDGKRAAVKVLRSPDEERHAQRFVRELEIARRVRGPNLVEVYTTGATEDGGLYIVMELLEGRDLAVILRDRPHLPVGETVALLEAVARGLDALHGAGVIHRDLKPSNLFLAGAEWKILDYGVSKLTDGATMTRGDIVGTPGYMSPEQANGDDIDARSDVFSLAAVAYRAISGRRPFNGSNAPQLMYQVVHVTPPRVREALPGLPRALDDVLMKGLAKKKEDRYRTAKEFADAFRIAAEPVTQPSLPSNEDDATTQVTPNPPQITQRR